MGYNFKHFILAAVAGISLVGAVLLAPRAGASSLYTIDRTGSVVNVDWSDSENASDYSVSTYINGTLADTVVVTDSVFSDTDTRPNHNYTYQVSVRTTTEIDDVPQETTEDLFTTTMVRYGLTSLSASARLASFNSISLSYTDTYGVTGYEIYRSTKKTSGFKKVASVNTTSYVNKSLALNTTYYYKVRGYQVTPTGTYYTNWSSVMSKRTALGKSTLKVAKSTYNSVKLSWTKADGANKYKVYRSTSKSKGYKHVKTTSSLSYTNKSLKTGTRYYYKVVPYRGSTKGSTTKVVSKKLTLTKPATIKVSEGLGYATVKWSKVSGASGYKVYRATSKNGKYKLVKTTKSLSYKNTKLGNDKTFYYKVKAYRNVGGKQVAGPSSTTIKAVTPRKAGQYRFTSSGWYVLEVSGSGYYSICNTTRCNWSYDKNDNFQNKAYVYVYAGQYLTFESSNKGGRITKLANYHFSPKSSFSKAGQYIVGLDLQAGTYRVSSNDYYYISVCADFECEWGNGYDDNDLLVNGGVRYITLYDLDFLTISNLWGTVKGSRV